MCVFAFISRPCTFYFMLQNEHEKNTQTYMTTMIMMKVRITIDVIFQVPIILEADSKQSKKLK